MKHKIVVDDTIHYTISRENIVEVMKYLDTMDEDVSKQNGGRKAKAVSGPKKCTCTSSALWMHGCKCGGV